MTGSTPRHAFFKGRVALHALLRAAGVGAGDQVLLPGYTCVVVPNAVLYTGAEPVYLDVETRTGNLDADRLEDRLGAAWQPGRAKVLIVQHTYGIPCDMDRLTTFARRHGLVVIEDACHALGAAWRGRPVGTLGDAAFFSSQWSKPVTTGLGGWAVANTPALQAGLDAVLADYARPGLGTALTLEAQYRAFRLLDHPRLFWGVQGLYRNLGRLGLAIGSSTAAELSCDLPADYRRRMHPLQERRLARLLAGQDEAVAARRRNTKLIEAALREAGLPTVDVPEGCEPVFLRYPVPVRDKGEVLVQARRARVPLGDWFLSPVHPNLAGWEAAGYVPGTCPAAEQLSRRVVNIPTGGALGEAEIRRAVAFVARHESGATP